MSPLDASEDALPGFRQVLSELAATIHANLPGTIDGTDPEHLHELRIAVRRTRVVLTKGKGVLPEGARATYRAAFGWLGQVTGPPRDLDVFLLEWERYVAPLARTDPTALAAVHEVLQARRGQAHQDLSAQLAGPRTTSFLAGWERWLADPEVGGKRPRPLGPVVAARVKRTQKRLLHDGRAVTPDSPPERLHDLRKDAKKLRYLIESFGSLFPGKPRRAFVAELKCLQDNLGAHQDAEVHVAALRSVEPDLRRAAADPDVFITLGRLIERVEQGRLEERAAFADRFAAYDTKANRRALAHLLRPARRP